MFDRVVFGVSDCSFRKSRWAIRLFGALLLICGCSDRDSVNLEELTDEKPPMFAVNRHGTGPLTLDELQINLPDRVDRTLNDTGRACFFGEVERLASEAGDPANLDLSDLPYWGGKVDQKQWNQFSGHMQRVLLAQAIVSWALMEC